MARLQIDVQIDWSGEKRELQTALASFVQELPQDQAEQVYADFEQVNQLCDEPGQRALRSMVLNDLDGFDALEGNEARGLRVLVADPSGFRHALSIAYSARLYQGRNWGPVLRFPTEGALGRNGCL